MMESYADFIPPRARCVVEFGCGAGRTGQDFRQIQPDCCYVGVDRNRDLLRSAAARLTKTAASEAMTFDFQAHGLGKADCLVYHGEFAAGAGLGEVLRRHAAFLSENGQVVFVMENPGYFRNLLALWQGQPAISKGRMAAAEIFYILQAAGLQIFSVIPEYEQEADQALRESPAIKAIQEAFAQIAGKGRRPEADVWAKRYIVRAVRVSGHAEPPLLLQTMIGDAFATARVRVHEPNRFYSTMPGIRTVSRNLGADLSVGNTFAQKILFYQRCRSKEYEHALQDIRNIRMRKYLLMQELDDNPVLWQEDYIHTHYVDFIGCHAIQVSTPALAELMKQYNPHVFVLENELAHLPEPRSYAAKGPVTLFFGAANREADWQEIMPALNRVLRRFGKRVQVKVIFDTKFYDALETTHKELIGQEYMKGYAPYPVYEAALHSADISLLPLRDTEFNRMKSDLKFIESAGNGAVVLASPTVYEDSVKQGETGLIYHSPQEFEEQLELLIGNRTRRLEIARAAYAYVRGNRLMAQHYEARVQLYRNLVAHWAELDRALQQRLDSLAKRIQESKG